jgi:hypothetical protein
LALLHPIATAKAQESQPRNNFGSVGLIEMPSARMGRDGELSIGASAFENTQHYNLTFQPMPWLETDFRYSALQKFEGYSAYFDRSFAFKARLWDETALFPAFAVGINDAVGTGIYSSEYFVASKKFGDFDATLGMGFGRLATANRIRNPLTLISSKFDSRTSSSTGVGQIDTGVLFRGRKAGIFGGVVWNTPIENLSAIAEYSSDSYPQERAQGNFNPRAQLNLGISYLALNNVRLGVNWLYNRSIGLNAMFVLDPATDPYPVRLGPTPAPIHIRSPQEQQLALSRWVHPESASNPRGQAKIFAALVDALWVEQSEIRNMEIRGRRLFVMLNSGDVRTTCETDARTLGRYGIAIDSVTVRLVGEAATPMQCMVTSGYALPLFDSLQYSAVRFSQEIPPAATAGPSIIDASRSDNDAARVAIQKDVKDQGIAISAISLTTSEATVYFMNRQYSSESEAVNRLTRVLMADAPASIEKFQFINIQSTGPDREFSILREPTERIVQQTGQFNLLTDGNELNNAPMDNPALSIADRGNFPKFYWSIFPQFRQELFDPQNPFAVQFLGSAYGSVDLLPGLSMEGEVEANVWDNFNTYRTSNSYLPHVRSDFLSYFTQGKNGIGNLDAAYRFRITPELHAVVKAGYFESMFAGAGGELLWRPVGERWAVGADFYEVKQRNFDRLFGLQPYHVATGHVSLYYASPWYDLDFTLRVGQYLAGDRGATLEITRRFATGVEIGAFVTKTNVSAAQFGEGSFDKGIMIRIPLDWGLPINTQNTFAMDLRPVQRDGGQRLLGDATLFDETRRASDEEIYRRPHIFAE